MKKVLFVSLPALGLLALAACAAPSENDATSSQEAISSGQCEIGNADRAKLDDPFFKKVLDVQEASGSCPNDVKGVLARLKKEAGKDPSVFVVSENGDKPTDKTSYRFVLTQATAETAADELFVSALATKAGLAGSFLEVMAWSPKKQGYNYYHLVDGGRWELAGNGADAKVGGAPAFECMACHTSGGPLMREQQDSWANWNSNWFSMPAPQTSDTVLADLFAKKQIADTLEPMIVAGQRRHAKARTDRETTAKNLKGLLKQVMCEVAEPNIVASHSRNSERHASISPFPGTVGSVFVTQMFGHDGRQRNYKDLMSLGLGDISVRLDGAGYAKALDSAGMTVPTEAGPAKDAMFPMFTPDRGFADNLIIEELLDRKVLDKELVADLLMTDFTVPSYSAERCALADTAPTQGTTPEEIRTAWIANLASSRLAGAADLKARLEKKDDFAAHTATVKSYLAACNARLASDAAGFMEDTLRVVAQRRAEFVQKYPNIIESDSLLPVAKKWTVKPGAVRLKASDCTLEKR